MPISGTEIVPDHWHEATIKSGNGSVLRVTNFSNPNTGAHIMIEQFNGVNAFISITHDDFVELLKVVAVQEIAEILGLK
jgi:hypothetical protein